MKKILIAISMVGILIGSNGLSLAAKEKNLSVVESKIVDDFQIVKITKVTKEGVYGENLENQKQVFISRKNLCTLQKKKFDSVIKGELFYSIGQIVKVKQNKNKITDVIVLEGVKEKDLIVDKYRIVKIENRENKEKVFRGFTLNGKYEVGILQSESKEKLRVGQIVQTVSGEEVGHIKVKIIK